jgi:hypothetical protein
VVCKDVEAVAFSADLVLHCASSKQQWHGDIDERVAGLSDDIKHAS